MYRISVTGLLVAGSLLGCSQAPAPGPASVSHPEVKLAGKPEAALGVVEARKTAKDKQEIVLTGRIGGDPKPFVEGVAAFTMVDLSLKPCPPEEGCPTPWDYCCDTDQLPERKVLVRVVDASGKTISGDARQLLGVKELSTVTIRGTADRDKAGGLTVLATGVFVEGL